MLIQFSPNSAPHHLVREERLADVGPEVAHTGMARSSLLAAVVTRTSSGSDVPGLVTQCIRKSRSLNDGSSDWPSRGRISDPGRRPRRRP